MHVYPGRQGARARLRRLRTSLLAAALLFVLAPSSAGAAKILIVGNSFTTGIKTHLVGILRSSGRDATVVVRAQDGYTLEQHLGSAKTLKSIRSKAWDAVVLQEQSLGEFHVRYPAARALDAHVAAAGAQTVFMMTWRDRGAPLVSYDALRGAPGEDVGYVPIAHELGAPVAPVGWAYREAIFENASVNLWGEDGHHSNERGRYLAALSIYCAVFGESPVGLWAPASFPAAQVLHDQLLVERVALGNPSEWMIQDVKADKGTSLRKVVSAAGDDFTETLATGQVTGGSSLTVGAGRLSALRFGGLAIPAGSVVRSARLELYPSTGRTNPIVVEYAGVAADDAPPMQLATGAISKLPVTLASVMDAPPSWDGGVYNSSADLAAVVQEIVDRPGWSAGNALTILVGDAGGSATRLLRAFESGADRAPALVVELE